MKLLGAAARIRTERIIAPTAAEHLWNLRERIGDDAFHTAYEEGFALSIDEAAAWAQRGRGQRKRPAAGWDSLTPAEREVAWLAAAGMTNPEIAARLFITRGTVKTHLAHIYGKLGLRNRSELAAAAAARLAER